MTQSKLKTAAARGLLWGGIGSGGVQLLNLVFGVLLSRILSPSDYGMVGALAVFSAIAGIFTESGLTLAIVNRKNVDRTVYNAVFWFNVCVGVALYLVLFFLAPAIARFYDAPQMVPLSRFLFIAFVLGAFGASPSAYLFRNLMVKQRTRALLTAVAVSGAAGVVCALSGMGYWGIAVQTVTYSLVLTVMLWCAVDWRPSLNISFKPLHGMFSFGAKQMAVAIFNHINNNLFAVLLGRFYGMATTGFFTQGNKWTTMGHSTLSGMINSVGQPVLRQSDDEPGRLVRVFRKMLRFAAFISFPSMLGLGIVAHELITLSVTSKWAAAVPVMQILCIGGAFAPLSTLYGNLMNSISRPSAFLCSTVGLGLTQMAALFVTFSYSLTAMLAVYTAVNVAWFLVWQTLACRFIGLRWSQALADVLPYLFAALVVVAAAWFVGTLTSNLILALLLKLAVAASLYTLIMWLAKSPELHDVCQYLFKGKKL